MTANFDISRRRSVLPHFSHLPATGELIERTNTDTGALQALQRNSYTGMAPKVYARGSDGDGALGTALESAQRRHMNVRQHFEEQEMSYNEDLAERIRRFLAAHDGYEEKKRFGAIAFMLNGNMVCGVTRDDLMARLGPAATESALSRLGARAMDFTGRPMKAMVFVGPEGYASDADLHWWLDAALSFCTTLPPKAPRVKANPRRSRSS